MAAHHEQMAYFLFYSFIVLFIYLQLLTCSRVAAEKKAAP